MAERFCPECGMIEVAVGVTRCPECGLTPLDPADPENRSAIEEAIQLRTDLTTPAWLYVLFAVIFTAALVAGAAITGSAASGQVLGIAIAIGIAVVVERIRRSRMPPGWRAVYARTRTPEQNAARRRTWTSTTMIAVVLCVVFVAVKAKVGLDALAYQRGASPLRIITASLTHGGLVHLIGNVLALFVFGLSLDLRVGRLWTGAILIVAAIAGALAQASYSATPMVGISAAVYGLIGATVTLMPTRPAMLTLQGMAIPMPTWLWSLFMIPLFTLTAWIDQRSHVAWVAHLGGFGAGFVLGLCLRGVPPKPGFEDAERRRAERIERMASR